MTPRRDDDNDEYPDDPAMAADELTRGARDLDDGRAERGRFLTLDEVADTLRVDAAHVRTLVETYELPAIRVGGGGPWRVESDVLEQFIDDRYEAQRREARLLVPEADDFAELWGPRIPEDGGGDDLPGDVYTSEIGGLDDYRPRLRAVDDAGEDADDPDAGETGTGDTGNGDLGDDRR